MTKEEKAEAKLEARIAAKREKILNRVRVHLQNALGTLQAGEDTMEDFGLEVTIGEALGEVRKTLRVANGR